MGVKNNDTIVMKSQKTAFELSVGTESGKTVTVFVEPKDKILSLKKELKEKEGIHEGDQRLVFRGMDLENGKCFKDYNIAKATKIRLIIDLRFNIQVNLSFEGSRYTQKIQPRKQRTETISSLKKEILAKFPFSFEKLTVLTKLKKPTNDEDELQTFFNED